MTDDAAHEWTIATLNEHFKALLSLRDKALDLQAVENKRRLDELNHEHARVAAAQMTYVSKDTWEAFSKSDAAWKAVTDRTLALAVPRTEFQSYKDSTERALTLKAGQDRGIGLSASTIGLFISAAANIGAVITVIFLVMHGK